MSDRQPLPDHAAGDSPFDSQLFELLDQHVEALHRGEHVPATIDLNDSARSSFDSAARILDCLAALDRLAPITPIPPKSERVFAGPSRIGPYEIQGELGRGGMGVVYRARHSGLNLDLALKVIRSNEFATPDEIRRFHREARAAAAMAHPGIIRVHDVGEQEGLHYLTMDLIEGHTLEGLLREGPLASDRAVSLMAEVAQAVHYLHERGIVHRDLKPSNILLNAEGSPYVSDFGLAKVFDEPAGRTLSGTIIGTPDYMSPEQAGGHSSSATPQSDVFSLGAIFYEMLTGQAPFRGENPFDTLLQVLEAEPILPRKLRVGLSSELEQICLRCLEKNPERRYTTAREFVEDLRRHADGEPIALRTTSFRHRIRRSVRREPALAFHLLAIGIAAAIVQGRTFVSEVDWASHALVMGIFAIWALIAWGLQYAMRRERLADPARYAMAATDTLAYTTLLALSERWGWKTEMLVVGYPLLIVAAGLWFRMRLVWFMTTICVASFLGLRVFHPNPDIPIHFQVITATLLVIVGVAVSYQVYRFKLLDRVYQRQSRGGTGKT